MSETSSSETTTSSRRRSSSSSKSGEREPTTTYEEALEAGYLGGPADEGDYTVAGVIAAAEAEASE